MQKSLLIPNLLIMFVLTFGNAVISYQGVDIRALSAFAQEAPEGSTEQNPEDQQPERRKKKKNKKKRGSKKGRKKQKQKKNRKARREAQREARREARRENRGEQGRENRRENRRAKPASEAPEVRDVASDAPERTSAQNHSTCLPTLGARIPEPIPIGE